MIIDFKVFQDNCKHAAYGLKSGTVRQFELTCRKPECVPSGQSWSKCDRDRCPYFGMPITSGMMIDAVTGKTIYSFTGGRLVFGD